MQAYKFVPTATATKPDTNITRLLEKALKRERLSREEKDWIASLLYGILGSNGHTYRLSGWAWYMADCLPRILVHFVWSDGFHISYAPDKTSLRKSLTRTNGQIVEMLYAPIRR